MGACAANGPEVAVTVTVTPSPDAAGETIWRVLTSSTSPPGNVRAAGVKVLVNPFGSPCSERFTMPLKAGFLSIAIRIGVLHDATSAVGGTDSEKLLCTETPMDKGLETVPAAVVSGVAVITAGVTPITGAFTEAFKVSVVWLESAGFGVKEPLTPGGRPLMSNLMPPLEVPKRLIRSVIVAEPPWSRVAFGCEDEMLKSGCDAGELSSVRSSKPSN